MANTVHNFGHVVQSSLLGTGAGYWFGKLYEQVAAPVIASLFFSNDQKMVFLHNIAERSLPDVFAASGLCMGALSETSRLIKRHYPQYHNLFVSIAFPITIGGVVTYLYYTKPESWSDTSPPNKW